jgi:hypothetical protein
MFASRKTKAKAKVKGKITNSSSASIQPPRLQLLCHHLVFSFNNEAEASPPSKEEDF